MPVTEEFAWCRTGALAIVEGFDTINDDRVIALRTLHPAPFAARKIVGDFASPVRLDTKPV